MRMDAREAGRSEGISPAYVYPFDMRALPCSPIEADCGGVPGSTESSSSQLALPRLIVPDEATRSSDCGSPTSKQAKSGGRADKREGKKRRRHPVAKVKGNWNGEEDLRLVRLVEEHGEGNWSVISKYFPGRIGKQCRERWHNQLRPDIKRDAWTEDEERLLIEVHSELGNRWADIAKQIPGRTENAVKNHWNATLRRKDSVQDKANNISTILKEYMRSLHLTVSKHKRSHRYDDDDEASSPSWGDRLSTRSKASADELLLWDETATQRRKSSISDHSLFGSPSPRQLLDASAIGLGNTPQHKNMRPSRKVSQLTWGKPGYVDLEQQNQDGIYGDAGLMSLVDYLDSEADILPSASGLGALSRLGQHVTPDTYSIKQEVPGESVATLGVGDLVLPLDGFLSCEETLEQDLASDGELMMPSIEDDDFAAFSFSMPTIAQPAQATAQIAAEEPQPQAQLKAEQPAWPPRPPGRDFYAAENAKLQPWALRSSLSLPVTLAEQGRKPRRSLVRTQRVDKPVESPAIKRRRENGVRLAGAPTPQTPDAFVKDKPVDLYASLSPRLHRPVSPVARRCRTMVPLCGAMPRDTTQAQVWL